MPEKQRFNVLIVDDEYYFRELLLNLISWQDLGFDIVGQAEDGWQALELMKQIRVDLVVADINMPQLSGLDFMEKLRENERRVKVIFITSYDVFEFAREAVSLGASHFLLKPVDEEQLTASLADIHDELTEEEAAIHYTESLKKQVEQALPVLREGFIRQLLYHEPKESPARLARLANYYQIADADNYAVVIVEMDEMYARFGNEEDRQLWRFAIKNVCEETFASTDSSCNAIDGEDQQIILLIAFQEEKKAELHEYCENTRSYIEKKLKIRSTLAIGEVYSSLDQAHLSYAEARHALKFKFIDGGNRTIAYREREVASQDAVFLLTIKRNEWLSAIRHRNKTQLHKYIAELFERLITSRTSRELAMLALMECISIGGTAVLERGGAVPDHWLADRNSLLHQIFRLHTAIEMRGWVEDFFEKLVFDALEKPNANDPAGNSPIVRSALRYMEENFAESRLSLQHTARELFVNPSYLSYRFKKETGQTFSEYLTDLRLNEAMKLLSQEASTDVETMPKINRIAWQVGYSDPYYFSKCFKKKFGVTPHKLNI